MLTLSNIQQAQSRIKGVATCTPLILCPQHQSNSQLFFKPENFQPMGAFKLRGAYNAIASLTPEERAKGVVTHSSGNHAQAVAYAATALGAKSVIVMPDYAPQLKKDKTVGYGGELVLVKHSTELIPTATDLAEERGLILIPPYNDERVMAGQGTIGLEILEDLPDAGLVLVPVSGGGLISGIAAALKLSKPGIKVVGVEPELAGDAQASLRAGQIVEFPPDQTVKTVADGLRVSKLGTLTWPHIQTYVDDIVTVSETEILKAMRHLALNARLVAEPSGAVTFAAWLYHRAELPVAKNNVAVISGGNVEPEVLAKVISS
jgi:threonine dehydratase